MDYVAVCSGFDVLEVASNEAASLEGMRRYSDMRYPKLSRVLCGVEAFLAYSAGRRLVLDLEVVDYRPRMVVVEAGWR